MRRATYAWLGIGAWLAVSDARAQPDETVPGLEDDEARQLDRGDFWARTADPGRIRFLAAVRAGVELLRESVELFRACEPLLRELEKKNLPLPAQTRLQAEVKQLQSRAERLQAEAETEFRRAIAASPKRPEGWLALGDTLENIRGREDDAIAAFTQARALAGADHPALGSVSFSLGILLSRQGRFEAAIAEYDSVLQRGSSTDRNRSGTLANSAEALMALGRLGEAIDRYERAFAGAPPDADNTDIRKGIAWGLAVALDRDEQIARAAEVGARALSLDPKIEYFSDPAVFFIPEGDVHYYYALAYELAGRADDAKTRWQLFLQALPGSPWAFRAKQRLEALRQLPKPPPPRKEKPAGGPIKQPLNRN